MSGKGAKARLTAARGIHPKGPSSLWSFGPYASAAVRVRGKNGFVPT
jgi:hypothetical protein